MVLKCPNLYCENMSIDGLLTRVLLFFLWDGFVKVKIA
jgi:hypothetical protein